MNTDLSLKFKQVIEQIPRDVLYDFLCEYAQSHDELAMALVSEFWQAEKGDYRSMVQQCLMHPSPAGIKNGDGYDWGAVANDLSRMMDLAGHTKLRLRMVWLNSLSGTGRAWKHNLRHLRHLREISWSKEPGNIGIISLIP